MRHNHLSILRCPHCLGQLKLTVFDQRGTEIIDGYLACACNRWYPVIRGVPRLLPDALRFSTLQSLYPSFFERYHDKLSRHNHHGEDSHKTEKENTRQGFGYEWTHFRTIYPQYVDQFLDWIWPVKPYFFVNKLVLDAGCGTGRHCHAAAGFGARVVGVDFSEAVDVAYDNTRGQNVLIVQADIYHLPFAPGTFDYIFSIGVLHHLPTPQEGFNALVKHVRKGGHISIWVYGRENNLILRIANPLRKHLFCKLPLRTNYCISYLLGLLVHPLAQVYVFIERLKLPRMLTIFIPQYHFLTYLAKFPFPVVHSIIFDQLLAPVAFYISQRQIKKWFADAGIEKPVITWRNHNSWRGFGRVNAYH